MHIYYIYIIYNIYIYIYYNTYLVILYYMILYIYIYIWILLKTLSKKFGYISKIVTSMYKPLINVS